MLQTFKFAWPSPVFVLLVLLSLAGCKSKDPYEEYEKRQREQDDLFIQEYLTGNKITNFTKSTTGLYYLPQQVGTGAKIQLGNSVTMHYIGRFLNGQKFESSYDTGVPLTFTVGGNVASNGTPVLKGMNEGIVLMNNLEKSTLIIPSHLGYGRSNYGYVPAGTVLVYELTILDVK
ncbi:FKBP-type peptidyl-prolyl cis-trans isomerase [Adhaeribacter pallidiroseus]|uniref:Peptidyl-prolyl cis-trans isomerase n=1 Tax=Adhaeribacter pallidiroseus TaxID=2072847 RepID=A0A369QLL8_9BACT|nr:FKBP-type peptidyl-prolyl cis-trans isomerase [Adhaeribacter pallidiroseus]RDC65262.1 Peptidylprolyl isomerase [Adhaeribacter pallidiroseus]